MDRWYHLLNSVLFIMHQSASPEQYNKLTACFVVEQAAKEST
jgi:hypothetical protein